MATSFISPANEDALNNIFNKMQATFGRPITIYQTAQETVLVTNPNNNYLFNQAPDNSLTSTVIQSGVYLARIQWGKKQLTAQFGGAPNMQNQIQLAEGECRIKLDPTGAAFIADAERVQFDDNILYVKSDPRPHGLFDPNFRTFYLTRTQ